MEMFQNLVPLQALVLASVSAGGDFSTADILPLPMVSDPGPLPMANIDDVTPFNDTVSTVVADGDPASNCAFGTFKQCDSRWGSNKLGTSTNTICRAGCAMSCVAMILAGRGASVNPGTLNQWLTLNGGYASKDLIIWSAVDSHFRVSYQGQIKPDSSTLQSKLKSCAGLIANVRGGSHWVLLTGYQGSDIFSVHDPGFNQATYSLKDMSWVAVYAPTPPSPPPSGWCKACVASGGGTGCVSECKQCGSKCTSCISGGGGKACASRCCDSGMVVGNSFTSQPKPKQSFRATKTLDLCNHSHESCCPAPGDDPNNCPAAARTSDCDAKKSCCCG